MQIQQQCQEWWDTTQEDNSLFEMALRHEECWQSLDEERAKCFRNYAILQVVVIGMTAFFSMASRERYVSSIKDQSIEVTLKQDLNLRNKLCYAHRIAFD